jgi:hypothetical protein
MRNITVLSLAALAAFLFITCTSTQRPQQFKSTVDVPELGEGNYKTVDTTRKIAGIYFYNSGLGQAHVEHGDMTLRAFRDVMDNRVVFYKIDITTFSQKEQQHVARQVIGEPKLPAYIFIYKNGVLAKKVGSYDNRESAVSAADLLWRGFQDRVWRKK